MKVSTLFSILVVLMMVVFSCKKEDSTSGNTDYSKGVMISNEGPYLSGSGTVTWFNPDTKEVKQDIFETVNGKPLGNILQSMDLHNGKVYMVVNNAAKIEVADASTFKSTATITGFSLPRYFLGISDTKAYVTDWANVVDIVNLEGNTVTGTIPTQTGPDLMLKSGKFVFVLNDGGFSVDSTITVINSDNDQVVKTLNVYNRPTGIVEDAAGKVWVMCSGKGYNDFPADGDTKGYLIRLDPATQTIDLTMEIGDEHNHAEKLVINSEKNMLYFLFNRGVYRLNTAFAGAEPERVLSHDRLNALTYDGANNIIYTSDRMDFQQAGWVLRYQASGGALIDSIPAGIVPGCIVVTH
ncbi:MAG: hypothetical protein HXX13_13650 [Bacteroidetes bacterium]|nr:hypothetical protein [Bacteroidota bacterium]